MNMKKQPIGSSRTSTAAEWDPPVSSKTEVKLPADLWACVLKFAYLHEVMALTQVSKFFLNDVPPQLKHLLVRTGKSMDMAPAAIKRFKSVENVFIYSLIEEVGIPEDHDDDVICHLDSVTAETAAPFLKHIPKLDYFYLGGLSERRRLHELSSRDGIRMDMLTFNSSDVYDTPENQTKMRQLVVRVCQAFADGDLSKSVTFHGLLPLQVRSCCWKKMPKLSSYRDDVKCQVCDMICMTLPPLQVMQLHCSELRDALGKVGNKAPCISRENRMKIVKLRDGENYQSNLTHFFAIELTDKVHFQPVMCPPDYVQVVEAFWYSEVDYAEFQYLISKGANAKDHKIGKALIEYEVDPDHDWGDDDAWARSINNKRILTIETYNKLREIGLDIHENDFFLIDTVDKRSSYNLQRMLQKQKKLDPETVRQAKAQLEITLLDLHMGIDFEDFQRRVEKVVIDTHPNQLSIWLVCHILHQEFGSIISHGHEDAINHLLLEAVKTYH